MKVYTRRDRRNSQGKGLSSRDKENQQGMSDVGKHVEEHVGETSQPATAAPTSNPIVREYFGGREISSEDLEGALLVGLSPHARKKVEKRRGLYFKHSEWSAIPKIYKSTCPDTTESGTNVIVKLNESSRYNLENVISEVALSSTEQQYHTRKGPERVSAFTSNILNGNVDQSDGTCGSSLFLPKQASSKMHKKLSAFGNGPHGKQVMEHLLHTHGEDGIKQFCQRWRQVFVEAVHPQFLPSDWDVMSS